MRNMRLAVLWMAGLALGLHAVWAEIPVSFDHGKLLFSTAVTRTQPATGPAICVCGHSDGSDDLMYNHS